MTDQWANIAFFYLTVILVMNSLIIIMDGEMTDSANQLFKGVDITDGAIPDTFTKKEAWYEENIITNFIIEGSALVGGEELLRLGFEFATTVLSLGRQLLTFLTGAMFIYWEVFERIGVAFGLEPESGIPAMLSSILFIAQILAVIIVASRVREVLRL